MAISWARPEDDLSVSEKCTDSSGATAWHGHRAVEAIAQVLANEGWGFPVLHDMTDCLRIGDVTFVDHSNSSHTTVEIKTHVLSESTDDDGVLRAHYQVTVLSPSELPMLSSSSQEAAEGDIDLSTHSRNDSRTERQLHRLHVARQHQVAPLDDPYEADGRVAISTRMQVALMTNVEALQRVARKARRSGYACESVDGTFLYVAIYSPTRISEDAILDASNSLPDDLVRSGLLGAHRNTVILNFVADSLRSQDPQLHLPYFLLPLPLATVIDLLWRRMIIINVVSMGRVMDRMEDAGFRVITESDHADIPDGSLVVAADVEVGDGSRYRAEFHNLGRHVVEMAMEFRSVDYLVETAEAMRNAIPLGIEHRRANNDR